MPFPPIVLLISIIVNLLFAFGCYSLVKRMTRKNPHSKRYAWGAFWVWYLLPVPFVAWQFMKMPLPSDDYMIKHFNEHRQELEFVVKRYREEHLVRDPVNKIWWNTAPEVKTAMNKADVRFVTRKSGPQWHDEPYSIESERAFMKKIKSREINLALDKTRSSVIVVLKNSDSPSLREGASISKTYLYLPQVPRLDGNKVLFPVLDGDHKDHQRYILLKKSLDVFPHNWEHGECFLRALEPQWFIELCKSY